jgi:arsenate reductase (thioredoxin)
VTPIRVLFVCLGNVIRSQMAEGFARAYGADVVHPFSAGLAPGSSLAPQTRAMMAEKNIDLGDQFPKPLEMMPLDRFPIVVNISGYPLPNPVKGRLIEWKVADPVGGKDKLYREVRDEIETLVMRLILELRVAAQKP